MIQLNVYGDGKRDGATLGHLIEQILRVDVVATFRPWARLNQKKGYAGKIQFAIREALDHGKDGVVAVVDRDTASGRLAALRDGRAKDRAKMAPFPTALGEADPHGEVWLLDDAVAVRDALEFARDAHIVNIRKSTSPKKDLDSLIGVSRFGLERRMDALTAIAKNLDVSRCLHSAETGFRQFVADVNDELGALTNRDS